MRSIINISLPNQMAGVVDEAVSTGSYASRSEFFRDLIRAWLEGRLLLDLKESQKELKEGRGKLLKSLSELS